MVVYGRDYAKKGFPVSSSSKVLQQSVPNAASYVMCIRPALCRMTSATAVVAADDGHSAYSAIGSVRPQHPTEIYRSVRYRHYPTEQSGLDTGTRPFGKFGTTSIPSQNSARRVRRCCAALQVILAKGMFGRVYRYPAYFLLGVSKLLELRRLCEHNK